MRLLTSSLIHACAPSSTSAASARHGAAVGTSGTACVVEGGRHGHKLAQGGQRAGGWLLICCICIHPYLRARAVTEPTRRRTPKAPSTRSESRTRMILHDSRLGIGRETGSSLFPHSAAGGNGKWGPDWPQIGKSGEITRPRECPAACPAGPRSCQWAASGRCSDSGSEGCLSTGQLAMSDKKTTMSLGRRATHL